MTSKTFSTQPAILFTMTAERLSSAVQPMYAFMSSPLRNMVTNHCTLHQSAGVTHHNVILLESSERGTYKCHGNCCAENHGQAGLPAQAGSAPGQAPDRSGDAVPVSSSHE